MNIKEGISLNLQQVQYLIDTVYLMTNLAACRSEDLHDDLDGIWEVGHECLERLKKANK